MDKTTILEIPEEEAPKLEKAIEEAIRQLRELNDEYEARRPRIAALSSETDTLLEQIKNNLAYVEEYLRTPLPDLHVQ
ncbi:MAG: hypothetical protein JMDDDDMK_04673 [Acidobacteria bacterium]|nr:hypothetical protein [Acidobacteriota bacterium]